MPTGPRPAPPAGTARVAISGTILGHRWVNVWYLQVAHSGAVTVNDLQTIADGIHTSWGASVAPLVSSDVVMKTVDITYFPSAGTELRYTGSYSTAGGAAASPQDAGACFVIRWVIGEYYRGGHPRSYIPGVPAGSITNGSDLSATFMTNAAADLNAHRNAINALTSTNITSVTMGTVRYASGGAWLSPPRFVAYTSCAVGKLGKLGSQRRRILS